MPPRPELRERYEREMQAAREAQAAGAPTAATEAADRAAMVFAGSNVQEELDLRHEALGFVGSTWRRAQQPELAEAAYEALSAVARAELGPDSRTYFLGRYFVGLVRTDRDDDAGAALALREAYEGFGRLPDPSAETRAVGAALGLALLRLRRFEEVIEVLRRHAGSPPEDVTAASILHNLALALIHTGQAAAALNFIHQALNLRARLNGVQHPYYIETQLVEALARVDSGDRAGAAPIVRAAAAAVLAGGGETHPFFARALLVEARRVALTGDGAAAEALARRALHLLRLGQAAAGVIEENARDAAAIAPLWRTLPAARGPAEVRLWRAEMQHTLRRYQVHSLDFAESGDRPLVWYFFVPTALSVTDPAAGLQLARVAFADCNVTLHEREPSDANILDATSARLTEPSLTELAQTDFVALFRSRVWEPSVAFSLVEGSRSLPLAPAHFAFALCAYQALRGGRPDVESWAALGVDRGELERAVASPQAMLGEVLWR
ncbi:MAG: tetratricopeptide repeat protein [Verrucomicrobia bacterium]|nr:tetratricopeptide repeat protein [Verrucomicrobiota bacterium]